MHPQFRILSALYFIAMIGCPITGFGDDSVWENLKQGGYVILMRHATAEKTADPLILKIDDCSVQRNLSSKGRQEAALIGRAFRSRSIPVSEVLSSRYCRTRETAELAFGRVTTWQPLDLLYALPEQARDARTEIVAEHIGAYDGGDNLIMITHLPNIDALTLELVEPGGFLVLKPDHGDGFEVVGYFTADGLKEK